MALSFVLLVLRQDLLSLLQPVLLLVIGLMAPLRARIVWCVITTTVSLLITVVSIDVVVVGTCSETEPCVIWLVVFKSWLINMKRCKMQHNTFNSECNLWNDIFCDFSCYLSRSQTHTHTHLNIHTHNYLRRMISDVCIVTRILVKMKTFLMFF